MQLCRTAHFFDRAQAPGTLVPPHDEGGRRAAAIIGAIRESGRHAILLSAAFNLASSSFDSDVFNTRGL
jgi:hypothetical protein